MKEYTVKRYSYNELNEEAKEKAVAKVADFLAEIIDADLEDYLNDRLIEKLGGESDLDLRYSLGYSQGDGVAIYGSITKEEAPNLTWGENIYAELTKNAWSNHYSHYNTFNVEVRKTEDDDLREEPIIEAQLRKICRELEKEGYEYIQEYTGREAAEQFIEANYSTDFTEEGVFDSIE